MPQAEPINQNGLSVCPNCGAGGLADIYEVRGIPVHSTLNLPTAEAAVNYPRGDLALAFCATCGFLCNRLFDPTVHEYCPQCEESQAFSPTFNAFARGLAQRWVQRYGVRNKTIVEIGCGKADFLMLICEAGDNRGIGIDPSARPDRIPPEHRGRIRLIRELYGPQHACLQADVLLCRHTLEHIAQTRDFLAGIRRTIGARRDTLVLFELPDVARVLREGAFWDIYYEHCSYFSAGSLARLFRSTGFEVVELERDYADQYLLLAAYPADGPTRPRLPLEDDLAQIADLARGARERFPRMIGHWRGALAELRAQGAQPVVWGALSKGVSFLTTLGLGADQVPYVVDINPHRQGSYMAGTGQRIINPQGLRGVPRPAIVAMNPIYCDEIRRQLRSVGVEARVLPVVA